jgi:hypothetical protein
MLAKVTVVKIVHQNTSVCGYTVVVWLHILGPYWCMYVALFVSRLVYWRTVQHTYTNKDLIYAATPPLYNHTPIYFDGQF